MNYMVSRIQKHGKTNPQTCPLDNYYNQRENRGEDLFSVRQPRSYWLYANEARTLGKALVQ